MLTEVGKTAEEKYIYKFISIYLLTERIPGWRFPIEKICFVAEYMLFIVCRLPNAVLNGGRKIKYTSYDHIRSKK